MAGHGLGRPHRNGIGPLPKDLFDNLRFNPIGKRGCGMSINISHRFFGDPRILNRTLHTGHCTGPIIWWSGNMKGIAIHSIADHLGINVRASRFGVFQFL